MVLTALFGTGVVVSFSDSLYVYIYMCVLYYTHHYLRAAMYINTYIYIYIVMDNVNTMLLHSTLQIYIYIQYPKFRRVREGTALVIFFPIGYISYYQ